MSAEILPILDHLVANARDALEETATLYRQLGFFLTEPSRHTLGSVNRTAVFAQDYLELIGIDRAAASPRLELLRSPLGIEGLVFNTPDAGALYETLQQRGVPATAPIAFSRPVALPQGPAEARFRVVHLTGVSFGRCYFCQHLTPELVWRDAWRRHANGVEGIARIAIATADPAPLAGFFRSLFGDAAVDDATLRLKGTLVEIVPLAEAGLARDAISALDFRVRSLDEARRALAAGGVAVQAGPRRIEVLADDAFGARIAFA
jgi:hypothetical protein